MRAGTLTNPAASASQGAGSHWVERRNEVDAREFREQFVRPRRPLVLTDALRGWSALETFTPEFFRRNFADAPVRIRGQLRRLGEVLDLQLQSTSDRPGPYPCTLADCPQVLAHVTPRFECSLPSRHASALIPRRLFELVNHLEIFFGGPGGEFPYLHYDMLRMHAWIAQVYGEKEFTLYERGQEHLLYVNPKLPWLSTVQNPHDLERYPLLREARTHKVVLRAGEALFIPCGTWHTARCLSMNITVAFDQLEASNWREFVGDVVTEQRRHGRRAGAFMLGAYLRAIGPVLTAAEKFGANRGRDWSMRMPRKRAGRHSLRKEAA